MSKAVNAVMELLTVIWHTIVASGIWIAEQVKQQASRRSSVIDRSTTASSQGVTCDLQCNSFRWQS